MDQAVSLPDRSEPLPAPVTIRLPKPVRDLYDAHVAMCAHFAHTGLTFTLDGKLVGDIGEALVAEAFGLKLNEARERGIDGRTADGRSVQIKATGLAKAGPAFTPGEEVAEHLIFLRINFAAGFATVLYNGPEAPVRALLPEVWSGTKRANLGEVLKLDRHMKPDDHLPLARA